MSRCFPLAVLPLAVLLIAGASLPCERTLAQSGAYRPIQGEPHPEVVLPSIEDQRAVALSQFRGKKVLLIHFASW